MTITVNFDDSELQPLIQRHLDSGRPVASYIRTAVTYWLSAEAVYTRNNHVAEIQKYSLRYAVEEMKP